MVDVRFEDEERVTLLTMALCTMAHINGTRDPELHGRLLTIVRKLEGTDTVLVATRRSYWTMPPGDTGGAVTDA